MGSQEGPSGEDAYDEDVEEEPPAVSRSGRTLKKTPAFQVRTKCASHRDSRATAVLCTLEWSSNANRASR